MTAVCPFPECLGHKMNLRTARKKGTYTLAGGKKQQIWHCKECGKAFQTTIPGDAIVDSTHKKKPAGKP